MLKVKRKVSAIYLKVECSLFLMRRDIKPSYVLGIRTPRLCTTLCDQQIVQCRVHTSLMSCRFSLLIGWAFWWQIKLPSNCFGSSDDNSILISIRNDWLCQYVCNQYIRFLSFSKAVFYSRYVYLTHRTYHESIYLHQYEIHAEDSSNRECNLWSLSQDNVRLVSSIQKYVVDVVFGIRELAKIALSTWSKCKCIPSLFFSCSTRSINIIARFSSRNTFLRDRIMSDPD